MQQISIKARALRLLARREHSRAELEAKLAPHAASSDELAAALDDLEAKGFISEARVVQSVLYSKSAQWGKRRMAQTLAQKGIAPDVASHAIAQLQEAEGGSEFDRALALWQRRFGHQDAPIDDDDDLDHDDTAHGVVDVVEADPRGEDETHDKPARRVARKAFQSRTSQAEKQRTKQMRFLLGRGFDGEVVAKVLKSVSKTAR